MIHKWQTALGYYQDAQTAAHVLNKLKSHGLMRCALIHRDHEGRLEKQTYRPSPTHITLIGGLAAAFILLIIFHPAYFSLLLTGLMLGMAATVGSMLIALDRYKIESDMIQKLEKLVIPDETLVVVQVEPKDVPHALKFLRQVESGHPISFLLRCPAFEPAVPYEIIKEPLTLDQMHARARELAETMRLSSKDVGFVKPRGHPLLQSLNDSASILAEIRQNVAQAEHVEQTITSSAEWLLDNAHVIGGNIEEVRRNLPKKFYRKLPQIVQGASAGLPRISRIAQDIIDSTAYRLSREAIVDYLNSFQAVEPLTIGELWALPLMLRLRLIEGLKWLALDIDRRLCESESASFWGNRLLNVARRDPQQFQSFFNILAQEQPNPSSHFAEELLEHLFDNETIIPPIRTWLEEKLGAEANDILHREQMQHSTEQVAFSCAIVSLITLTHLSWHDIFESVCPVDALLAKDPLYPLLDFATRDSYRHAVETIARHSEATESQVAESALQFAEKGEDETARHVGYYFIDQGRPVLESKVACQPTFLQRLRRGLHDHSALSYLGGAAVLTMLIEGAIFTLAGNWPAYQAHPVIISLLALLPASELSLQVMNLLFTRILTPHLLPRLSYETGIPEESKTLVVVPVLLTNPQEIEAHIQNLEIRYLANPDLSLLFGLIFDFTDAPQEHMPEDRALLETAINGIKALEEKYGPERFFLFHRNRVLCSSEGCWIGWERKRGKLECLNRFLIDPSYDGINLQAGSKEALSGIKYVITLDADTQLPKDVAKKMIATLAHPLNSPRFDGDGNLIRGYTIIQPRVNADFAKARLSWFARLFSDTASTDPYSQAVSEIYQDLTYEGIYQGKGIYDLYAFNRTLTGRFPEKHLLSHDLLEGIYARAAFASDISLFEPFPLDYPTWAKRLHRWMRGDWQIIDWVFSNSISTINRWKIADNLRRALLPVGIVALLVYAWFLSSHPCFWTVFGIFVLLLPVIVRLFSNTIRNTITWLDTGQEFLKVLITAALLPHQAYLSLDALARVIYRRLISHRHLLEWTGTVSLSNRRIWIQLSAMSLLSAGLLILLASFHLKGMVCSLPLLLLWICSPFLVHVLDRPRLIQPSKMLSPEDRRILRKYARATWRYFDDFVGPHSNWLPPDNYQAALLVEVAERTSPTNIGLWMLTVVAAHDLNYVTSDEVIDRILATLETLKKLETYEGHLLNWYDTKSLRPLYPRYVSSVDSGNLIACLWTLEQAITQLASAPLLPLNLLEGLNDTWYMIDESAYPELKKILDHKPDNAKNLIDTIASALQYVRAIPQNEDHPLPYGLKKLEQQLEAWEQLISRYFAWMSDYLISEEVYKTPISLDMLAKGELPESLQKIINGLDKEAPQTKQFLEALHTSQWLAGEKLGQARTLLAEISALTQGINMQFLYNRDRRLFSIGYHVDDRKLDSSYYDLIASECRIASVVAIAKGDVPVEHWWALGRPYRSLSGQDALLSWGGTMFEYLMPMLFNPFFPDSLLGNGCKVAVDCQMRYGKRRGIPWGISESAYSEIDARRTYQYRSFGVPGLGLKRGLEEDLVVSPYSTALALAIHPAEALKNLNALALKPYSMFSDYGFYESIDFARQHAPHGERGVIIYAFMAHHQGMSLLAFNNILNDNPFPKRFHANPRISGVELLLYERTPLNPPIAKESRKEIPISRLTPFSTAPIMGMMHTPHSLTPKVNLISNGSYSVMMTNSGGGYSRWKEIDISRWRSDSTLDNWGSFCYIKDLHSGAVWSNTFQPTHTKDRKYSVSFKADKIEVHRRDHQFETISEIVVSPEDDAEVRLLTLANLSQETRTLQLTSYLELSLAPHPADRAHPCFNKMFIETESLPEDSALLAFRRARFPEEEPIFAAHFITGPETQECQFETDRARFIGRGRTLQNPVALSGDLSNSSGTVLDPIFSLRYNLKLAPGERAQVAFVTAIANDREKAIGLVKKYGQLASCHRVLEMAWTHAQLELRHLRIHQEEAQLFQKLASRILYPHAQLRPSADRLRKNQRGQSSLWAYGISGDLPIVAVSIADTHEVDLVKQALTAHAFWKLRGLKVDLVILNEEVTGYEHPLFEQLQRIIRSHIGHPEIGKSGGVFLINTDQIPEEDQTLILSVARANLIAARGSLRQQLVAPMEAATYPSRLTVDKKIPDSPSTQLPFLELPYFNGTGGYGIDGREYVIYLGPNAETPQPWINVIANPLFGILVTESGLGASWYGNSQSNRITPWSNDPLLNPITDAIYIRDDELGVFWTPTPAPIRELDAYRTSHGQGYSRFEHNSHGIEQELLVFVPIDNSGGLPLRIQRLSLFNNSPRRRILSLYGYSEWVLGTDREETQIHILTEWDLESQALFAYNRYNPDFGSHMAFAFCTPLSKSYTANRTEFLGRNGRLSQPAALKRKSLSALTGAALDPCAALQIQLELAPGEKTEVEFILGYAENAESARSLILKCRENGFAKQKFEETKEWWDRRLSTIQVELPDLAISYALNRWLLYQNLSCRFWGRAAFYQSSGAYGFRDQLQDAMALLYSAPEIAREHILRAAAHQFEEGDVQHWWHPPSNGGVRTRISDDLLWLPYVTAQYVRVTKDTSILEESIPFLKADLLKEDQHEAYFIPQISEEKASLLEHCRRTIYKGTTEGPHGLPLIGGGDWNDGMNHVGLQGKGESVWLAWFLIQVLHDFADLQTISGQPGQGEGYRTQAKRLAQAIEDSSWDGNWYRRAYFDDGAPLGSSQNIEDTIDSLPQSWAVISGAADPQRATQALKSVEEKLVIPDPGLILLLTPPFDKTPLDPGYIKGYPPGVRENGGQYTHGSLWVPLAFARLGDGDKAVNLLRMMHPYTHSQTPDQVQRYKTEPYVLAGDVYALPGQIGRGGWSWYSGSAGWMYRIWLEDILGFTLRGDRLSIHPTLHTSWDRIKILYQHQTSRYEITIENPKHLSRGNPRLELDGTGITDEAIQLVNDGQTHILRVVLD